MALRAFALKAEYEGTREGTDVPVYVGNNIPLQDGGFFSTRDALDEGNGLIVLDENVRPEIVEALTHLDGFKEISVPDGHVSVAGYEGLTKPELVQHAEQRGIANASSLSKAELITQLQSPEAVSDDSQPAEGQQDAGQAPAESDTTDSGQEA